jgi:hypothetical protein
MFVSKNSFSEKWSKLCDYHPPASEGITQNALSTHSAFHCLIVIKKTFPIKESGSSLRSRSFPLDIKYNFVVVVQFSQLSLVRIV